MHSHFSFLKTLIVYSGQSPVLMSRKTLAGCVVIFDGHNSKGGILSVSKTLSLLYC